MQGCCEQDEHMLLKDLMSKDVSTNIGLQEALAIDFCREIRDHSIDRTAGSLSEL